MTLPVTNKTIDSECLPVTEQPIDSEGLPFTDQPIDSEGLPVTDQPIDSEGLPVTVSIPSRLYFSELIKSLDCTEDDSEALFTLCLIHSLLKNQGEIFTNNLTINFVSLVIVHGTKPCPLFRSGVDCELLRAVGILPGQVRSLNDVAI